MMGKFGKFRLILLLLSFILILPVTTWGADDPSQDMEEVYFLIENLHVNPEGVKYGSIEEMIESLNDPYTQFFSREDYETFLSDLDGSFTGVGMYVTEDQGVILVSQPIKDTPAEEAGILKGDRIISIDGVSIQGLPLEEVTARIKGKEGTQVNIGVERAGEVIYFEIVRKKIELPIVEYEITDDGIGYIHIISFGDRSYNLVKQALSTFLDEGIQSLIIDVRGNPGGRLDQVVEMINLFVNDGPILWVKNNEGIIGSYNASEGVLWDKPVILLVDEFSASASEILAGAFQDYGIATIIGEQTFGKGTVQSLFSLTSGNILKLTVEEYFSPHLKAIDGIGVSPDIKFTDSSEQGAFALEMAKGIMSLRLTDDGAFFVNDYSLQEYEAFAFKEHGWYVSLYKLMLIAGGELAWDQATGTATYQINEKSYSYTNGEQGVMIKNQRMYVPLQQFMEESPFKIEKDQHGTYTLILNSELE